MPRFHATRSASEGGELEVTLICRETGEVQFQESTWHRVQLVGGRIRVLQNSAVPTLTV
jgi:hypothetical protein